jgi:GNAT superfamily N-acetyltransferase
MTSTGAEMSGDKGYTVRLSTSQEAKSDAALALYRYNIEITGKNDRRPIGGELCDASGQIQGGLWGRTELGLLFLDMFFLPVRLRKQGNGSRLLALVEDEAKRRGCLRAVVETSSFQAPGFYLRHGYQELGRVDFGLNGHSRLFFCKTLK